MNYDEKLAVTKLNTYYQQNKLNESEKPEWEVTSNPISRVPSYTAKCKFNAKVTQATAASKNEAKRLAACQMLDYLHSKDPSKFSKKVKQVQLEPTRERISEDFSKERLSAYFDDCLETREKNLSQFNRDFVKNVADNLADHFGNVDAGFKRTTSPKSSILDKIVMKGFEVVNSDNAPKLFKKIVEEMKLMYFCEFLETTKNDRYMVMIKLNFHLFTVCGLGDTPKEAIGNSCRNAIEHLLIFNS